MSFQQQFNGIMGHADSFRIPMPNASPRNPLEVFVGNLSYFCEEKDLYELFNQYSTVTNVRVMRNDDKSRSLMFGFIVLTSRTEVEEICRLLHGHLFLGRHLRWVIFFALIQYACKLNGNRVEPSDISGHDSHRHGRTRNEFQIHVAITSSFSVRKILCHPILFPLTHTFFFYRLIKSSDLLRYFCVNSLCDLAVYWMFKSIGIMPFPCPTNKRVTLSFHLLIKLHMSPFS